jgi:8-oxo-dGTP pyrophosphatase MutT (NUDIX family)
MTFHYKVRGIISVEGRVLLAHLIGADNTFLPGGHVETGESAEVALVREIEEEFGRQATIRRFLGAVEHAWADNGQHHHEINLLFEVEVPGLRADQPPASQESHIEFIWSRPEHLEKHNLQPYTLIACIRQRDAAHDGGYWASSLLGPSGRAL